MRISSSEAGEVVFSCEGDIGKLRYNAVHEDDEENEMAVKIVQTGVVQEDYSMRHLCHFVKACDLSPTVWLFLQQGQPLMVKYEFGDLGHMVFVLAPRVSESEEEEEDMQQ